MRRADNGDLYWYDQDQERDVLLTSFQEFDRGWYDTYIDGCEQGAQPQEGAPRSQGARGRLQECARSQIQGVWLPGPRYRE